VLVPLTVVPNIYEAEMLCGLLRTEGITCDYRSTDLSVAFGAGQQSGAAREILVEEVALERARELLAASKDA
jgi:hypothetical protein